MAMTGTKDVHKFGAPAIDYATGMSGAFALASALFQRERTGRGQRIDMAMLDVAMILMSSHLTGYLRNGVHPKPHGNHLPGRGLDLAPTSQALPFVRAAPAFPTCLADTLHPEAMRWSFGSRAGARNCAAGSRSCMAYLSPQREHSGNGQFQEILKQLMRVTKRTAA